MNLEQRLRESLVAPDPGAVFTARVMARMARGRARRGRRFIVIGAVLVAGVAAAMLAVQLTGSRAPVAATADPVQRESSAMPASMEALPSAGSEVHMEDQAQSVTKTEQAPAISTESRAGLRIVLMPAKHNSQEAAAKPPIDAFHSALLQALRNTPDVVVEVAGTGSASNLPTNRVTVVSPLVTTLSSGARVYRSGDGQHNFGDMMLGTYRGPPRWMVEVMLQPATEKNPDNIPRLKQYVDGSGNPGRGSCEIDYGGSMLGKDGRTGELGTSKGFPEMCASAEGLASWIVAALRQQATAPVDSAVQLISRLSDTSGRMEIHRTAFTELLWQARQDGLVFDAATLDAITAYIAGLAPDVKASSLMSLRGIRQPGLVKPLLDALQRDGEEKVRLQALATLAADYSSDSRVRTALETVARQDVSQLVRLVAQRPLSGDAQWQSYVRATLANRSLSPEERLAPAMYDLMHYPEGSAKMQSYLGSAEDTRQLLDLFQELNAMPRTPSGLAAIGVANLSLSGNGGVAAMRSPADSGVDLNIIPSGLLQRMEIVTGVPVTAVSVDTPPGASYGGGAINSGGTPVLSGSVGIPRTITVTGSQGQQALQMGSVVRILAITNPSAALDLRIRILTEDPQPDSLSRDAINALVEKRNDPRVSKVLDDIAAGKSGAQLRFMLESNLATRP